MHKKHDGHYWFSNVIYGNVVGNRPWRVLAAFSLSYPREQCPRISQLEWKHKPYNNTSYYWTTCDAHCDAHTGEYQSMVMEILYRPHSKICKKWQGQIIPNTALAWS